MKKVFTLAFLAVAMSASAQEIITSSSDPLFPERINMKELKSLSHDDATGQVNAVLFNGAEYTLPTSVVESMTAVTPKDAITLGKYQNMEYVKKFTDVEKLSDGELIGILDQFDYTVDDFCAAAYTDLYGMESLFQMAVKANIVKLAAQKKVLPDDIRIHVTDIVYASSDVNGHKILLSGRLIYPYCVNSNTKFTLSRVYVDHHTSLFDDATSPSFSFGNMPLCGMCSNGYLVVQPDLQGFGVSTTLTQMYIDNKLNPKHAADCTLAAMQYVTYTKYSSKFKALTLSNDVKMINAGGSQGGYTALAMEKYIETELDKQSKNKLPEIIESRIYASPNNAMMTLDEYAKLDTLRMSVTLPMLIQCAVVGHPKEMVYPNGTPISVHDFFIPELKTRTWNFAQYGLDKDYTIWQLMNSKKLNSSMFIWALCSTWGQIVPTGYENVTFGWMLGHKVMAEGTEKVTVDAEGNNHYELNYEDDRIKALKNVLDGFNLNDASVWVPQASIRLTHGNDDRWVPYQNSVDFVNSMKPKMEEQGHYLDFTTLENTLELGGHGVTCYMWMLAELYDVPVQVVIDLIKAMKSAS